MRRIVGLAAALAFLFAAAAQAAEPVDLLIRHPATVDVAAGTVTPERAIAVRGHHIVAGGPDGEVRAQRPGAAEIPLSPTLRSHASHAWIQDGSFGN